MARAITRKKIKVHVTLDGHNDVYETEAVVPYKDLMKLNAKPRYYKNPKTRYYLIKTNFYLTF